MLALLRVNLGERMLALVYVNLGERCSPYYM